MKLNFDLHEGLLSDGSAVWSVQISHGDRSVRLECANERNAQILRDQLATAVTDFSTRELGQEQKMSKLQSIRKIADLSYDPDPEWDEGYVAEVGSAMLARSYCEQLETAGFDASWSTDDRRDDPHGFVWVK